MSNSLTDPKIIRRLEILEKDLQCHTRSTLTMLERIRQVEKELIRITKPNKESNNE